MNESNSAMKAVRKLAEAVRTKFASLVLGQPEDQLKGPADVFLTDIGPLIGVKVVASSESTAAEASGRPDFGIAVGGLLTGHLELKKPGTGAETSLFKGHNAEQWKRF